MAQHLTFEEWYSKLQQVAKEQHWTVDNPEEWRTYYAHLYTPEQAFKAENGDSDDEDPAMY